MSGQNVNLLGLMLGSNYYIGYKRIGLVFI